MAQLPDIIALVEESLDQPDLAAAELARRACLSRFHFDRLASAALGEPPGAFRRRLMLERAAYQLSSTAQTVTQIGTAAGYTSPDAFTRAFFRGYGLNPSAYRRSRRAAHDLPAANGIHFHPPGGLRLPAQGRSSSMETLTRMYDHHVQLTGDIIDRLPGVSDRVLDQRIELSVEGIDSGPSLRVLCDKLVRQLEMWVTAVEGGSSIPAGDASPAALRTRLGHAAPAFRTAVVERIAAGDGSESFLDATCDPPQTFNLAGVLAHVLTFAAVRRTMAVGALESAGIGDLGSGDPMRFVGGEGDDASQIRRNFGTARPGQPD
jgi:AraC family transcriptional regulator